jgi:hypothetical protein
MLEVPESLDFRPAMPADRSVGIGCIGAGFIMSDCHLEAYRKVGFRPVAIASRRRSRAEEAAKRHGIPRVHADYRALLDDPEVQVVDIAVPPDVQPEIIAEAVRRGGRLRGILAQKPLALDLPTAARLVELCRAAGVLLAVNQNMRYDQSIRALRDLLSRGLLGPPVLATIDMRAIPHWMDWAKPYGKLTFYLMSIHHLDAFRFLFGNPERVLASSRPDPRTGFPHRDGITLYILEYEGAGSAGALRCVGTDDVWTGPAREGSASDIAIRWRVEGEDGLAEGTIGWPDWPARTPSTLRYTCREGGRRWIEPRWEEAWFPDAFAGPMADLLLSLERGTEPETSGRDNLDTIALVEACYRGATEHRILTLREIRSQAGSS